MEKEIQRLSAFQLPNRFIRIGIGITIASFIGIILIKVLNDSETLIQLCRQLMLVGLLLVSISKDKEEDELIVKLRMQSYAFAFIVGIVYALVIPLLDFLLDSGLDKDVAAYEGMGDFMILWILLSVQIVVFNKLKYSYR